jgi:hypothetical protein
MCEQNNIQAVLVRTETMLQLPRHAISVMHQINDRHYEI